MTSSSLGSRRDSTILHFCISSLRLRGVNHVEPIVPGFIPGDAKNHHHRRDAGEPNDFLHRRRRRRRGGAAPGRGALRRRIRGIINQQRCIFVRAVRHHRSRRRIQRQTRATCFLCARTLSDVAMKTFAFARRGCSFDKYNWARAFFGVFFSLFFLLGRRFCEKRHERDESEKLKARARAQRRRCK
jgi:hypothetical protein